jgi:protein TonB
MATPEPKPAPAQAAAPIALPTPQPHTPQAEPKPESIAAAVPIQPKPASEQGSAASTLQSSGPLAIAPAVDTTWYQIRQVDRPPRAIGEIKPIYPEAARRRGQEGNLKLMVKIDDLGQVQEVEVIEAQPAGIFEAAAMAAFRNARFQPALVNGRPVRFQAYMRVEFKLE